MKDIYVKAVEAAIEGGKEILKIYELDDDIKFEHKADDSPITLADKAANSKIIQYLKSTGYPIISEENKQVDYAIRKNWDTCWIVDPLDGTKEFIAKNGEFTVNIALSHKGIPIFGVIYVPVTGDLYFGQVEKGKAYKIRLDKSSKSVAGLYGENDRIFPAEEKKDAVTVVGSRSHMNRATLEFIEKLKTDYSKVELVSKGSSLKFCLVSEGKANLYPRFAPTMEWDTAAGQAICNAVGLKVCLMDTDEELKYNKEDLLNPYFLVKKK